MCTVVVLCVMCKDLLTVLLRIHLTFLGLVFVFFFVVCKLKKNNTHPPPTFLSLEPSSTHFANKQRLTDVKLQLLTY